MLLVQNVNVISNVIICWTHSYFNARGLAMEIFANQVNIASYFFRINFDSKYKLFLTRTWPRQ